MRSHRRATPLDVMMFRGEASPRTRSAMVAVYLLDSTPPWDDVVEQIENASRTYPGLRERLVEASTRLVDGQWVVDPDFDLEYHLRRVDVPAPGTLRAVLDLVEAALMSPLDRSRPLWEATLVEGIEGGRSALVMKVSHAVTDGVGGIQLQSLLFDTERVAPRRVRAPAPIPIDLTPNDLTMAAVRRLPVNTLGALGRLAGLWAGTDPREALGQARAYAGSLGRTVAAPAPPSPLLAGRSNSRRVLWSEVGLDEVRRAAHATGGTVNDVYLAALAGALGGYHDELGVPVGALSTGVPVNRRADDDPLGGNQWSAVLIAAPADERDPAERIRTIGQAVRRARDEPAMDALRTLAPVMSRLPDALVGALAGDAIGRDIQASNVRGWPVDTYFCGTHVERVLGFGPLPGVAVMAVMVSSAGTCTIGLNYDPAAITRPDVLQRCLESSVAEVVALGKPPVRVRKASSRKGVAAEGAPARRGAGAPRRSAERPPPHGPAAGIRRTTGAKAAPRTRARP